MGLKYWRFGAVALLAMLALFTGGAGAVLAADPQADPVVFDGVVTVHWADADDGPMSGAVVRIFFYHAGDEIQGIVPLGAPLDAKGEAVITGVPRAADGAEPLLLDVFGDLETSTIDEAGCTRFEGWSAQQRAVSAGVSVDIVLETSTKSLHINCPNPTRRPAPIVVGVPAAPAGSVLGATSRPQVTPPDTDAATDPTEVVGVAPFVPVLLALLGLTAALAPVSSLAFARIRPATRRQR